MVTSVREDLNLIHQSLKSWRQFTRGHRWGGLHTKWGECRRAIKALERVRVMLETRQMELPGLTQGSEGDS